ncbi:MAG: DUF3098 domain-containing protein [Mariniphaga sp.]|nr:DUF3098 domain-containing protein [Mariniphaga sp.]
MVFNKRKYIILSASILILALGFLLMSSNQTSEGEYFYENMFNFRRITLAPIIIIFAYVIIVITIFKKK